MKHVASIAFVYALLGAAGLTLAVPPGYASPVFPAAGFALACTLWLGNRALPGIWVGSAALNLGEAWLSGGPSLGAAQVALGIATAASLQAATGRWLVSRWQGSSWRVLEREQDAFRFLLLGGLLACTVSASIGVATLLANGVIERADALYTWRNWYVGDTLGVLVFAPLTLALLDRKEPVWRERRRRTLVPILVTLGVAFAAFGFAARWEAHWQDERLRTDGATIASHIRDRLIAHRDVLYSLRNFIEAVPDFSAAQFAKFTGLALRENGDIFALEYSPIVSDGQRAALETAMTAQSAVGPYRIVERDGSGRLVPAPRRPEYVPVRNVVPLAGNEPAIGFDIASEPTRRAAIEQARASNAMAVTAPIQLVQEQRNRVGLLELLPVYGALGPDSRAGDPSIGFATAVVKVDETIADATRGRIPPGLGLELTDAAASPEEGRLYRTEGPAGQGRALPQTNRWRTRIPMGDRDWELVLTDSADYRESFRPWLGWGVGVSGLVFAGLLQVMLLGMTGRTAVIQRYRDRLEELVEKRTRQLGDTNRFLRMVTDNLPSMVAYWNREQRCEFANAVYLGWFGRSPEAVVGMSMRELQGEELYEKNKPHIEAAFAGEPQQFERTLLRPDGTTGFALVSYIPDIQQGITRGIVVLVTDFTAIKQAQVDLQRLNDALREQSRQADAANQAKSQFLANMSHEIRTPMNAILGLAQVLERGPLAPEQRAMVESIRSAGRSLLGILNDILDLSKIEAGQLRVDRQPFELAPVLDGIRRLMGEMARAKGLHFRLETPEAHPFRPLGDPLRLHQVLVNLVGNAVKFTERGGVTLRVLPPGPPGGAPRLRIEVADTGIGIAPEQLSALGQPFVQADGTIGRRFGGTGLGLAIAKTLMELMGGTFGCRSAPGLGSTFWVELPAEPRAAETSRPEELRESPVASPATADPPRLSGLRCLVADDSRMNRDVMERALTLEGARASLAVDGREAVERLRAEPRGFDAVLMDIQMPGLDGLAATRAIRGELGLHDLPVVAVSAGVLGEQRQAALEAGMTDFLAKPVELEELVAMLRRYTASATPPDDRPEAASPAPAAAQVLGLPEIPGLDTHRAAAPIGNDKAFFLALLRDFARECADTTRQLKADLAQGDAASAARRLHTLRGLAGNVGALELAQAAEALQTALGTQAPWPEALLETFEERIAALLLASAPWLSALEPLPSDRAPERPLDRDGLAALRRALVRHDMAALDLFESLRPALAKVLGPAAAKDLAEAIGALRFEDALAGLPLDPGS